MQITIGTVGLSICSLALILNVIGLSIPYWSTGSISGSEEDHWHAGLWDFCGTVNDGVYGCVAVDVVNPYPEARDVFRAVRAMELLGMFTCVAALTFAAIKICNIKILLVREQTLTKLSGVGAIIAGSFMLIGVIVCAAKKKTILPPPMTGNFHAGFGLCVVSGVMSIVSGVTFLINRDTTHQHSIDG